MHYSCHVENIVEIQQLMQNADFAVLACVRFFDSLYGRVAAADLAEDA